MYTYSFEKLAVWKLSKSFAVKIYKLTEGFPSTEKFGIVSQLRRAAVSVCSNIAEGSSRKFDKEQSQFYTYSYGSVVEILNQLLISFDLGWINNEALNSCRTDVELISFSLNKLRNQTNKN